MPCLSWHFPVNEGKPRPSLALLADAYLKNGDPARPEALARAVAEIKSIKHALFAEDLSHDRGPCALVSRLPGGQTRP